MYIDKNRPFHPISATECREIYYREREQERDERETDKVIYVLPWIEIATDKDIYMDELKEKEIEIYTEKAINKEIETDKEIERW